MPVCARSERWQMQIGILSDDALAGIHSACLRFKIGGPWAIRTPDQLVKSQLLYRLS